MKRLISTGILTGMLTLMVSILGTSAQAQCPFNVDVGGSLSGNTFSIFFVSSDDVLANPCNIWTTGSQITMRWPEVAGSNPVTSLNFNSLEMSFSQNVGLAGGSLPTGVSGGDGFYYVQFTNNGFGFVSMISGTPLNVFEFTYTSTSPPAFEFVNTVTPIGNTDPAIFLGADDKFNSFISTSFPVEWLYFNAEAVSSRDAQLTWATATEGNNSFFQIEKSVDGQLFEPIARVQAVGNSTTTQEYDYLDKDYIANKVFYRLKQVDFDGAFSRSNVVEVNFDPAASTQLQFDLFPNPAHSIITLKPLQRVEGTYRVEIVDVTGRKVWNGIYEESANSLTVSVDRLAEGIYTVYMVGSKLGANHLVGRFVKK